MNKTISKDNAACYTWGDNCSSWVLSDSLNLSVKQELMPACTREQLHYHQQATQFFFVINCVATFYIEDQKIEVKEQEGITIERNQKHFVVNNGTDPIEFLVISQPSTQYDRINL